ncbi:hypothetical protein BCV70DRAFT_202752 [Testicularia cyperi]|uniref:Uncharacterized protein n=1 Tax=Testicularia cyperi TaxID=1882483 RepID=A0A317XI46_9BASI|nr:hypothetical protein BCV70DRAFT_203288 [Testicularia cyperi]PWY97578.1 hypothetical protein BCV70DRAFT_202752 [Testicularia cyperi]
MPLRKPPPTPRSAAVLVREQQEQQRRQSHDLAIAGADAGSTSTATRTDPLSGPLVPFKPGQTSLRNQAILTEQEYTDSLSTIIKRDFFPHLDRITAENEYLTALEVGDHALIRASLDQLIRIDDEENCRSKGTTHAKNRRLDKSQFSRGGTPLVASASSRRGEWDETPLLKSVQLADGLSLAAEEDGEEGDEEARLSSGITPDLGLSLSEFQARYTSEDNASFSQILDRDNQIRAQKHALLYQRETLANRRRQALVDKEREEVEEGKKLAIETARQRGLAISAPDQRLLIEDGRAQGTTKRSGPSGEMQSSKKGDDKSENGDPMDDLILVSEPTIDTRTPNPGAGRWKYTARNPLMFAPDANVDKLRTTSSMAPVSRARADAGGAGGSEGSQLPRPSINLRGIRFAEYDDQKGQEEERGTEEPGSGSPSSSRVDAAIRRSRARSSTATSTSSATRSRALVDESPRVNGYGFVSPYSTPRYSEDGGRETPGLSAAAASDDEDGGDERIGMQKSGLLRMYASQRKRRAVSPASASVTASNQVQDARNSNPDPDLDPVPVRRSFQLPPTTPRDRLAAKLAASAAGNLRTKAARYSQTNGKSERNGSDVGNGRQLGKAGGDGRGAGDSTSYGTQRYGGLALRTHAFLDPTPRPSPASQTTMNRTASKSKLTPAARALLDRSVRRTHPAATSSSSSWASSPLPTPIRPPSSSANRRREVVFTSAALGDQTWSPDVGASVKKPRPSS